MGQFDAFVLFAEMRTGSNFLEANLNALPGVACHGEAFNPHFIGVPGSSSLLGMTMADRQSDPFRLLAAIRNQPGQLGGFRYFSDHDPRILDNVLADPRVAKIILTRNPVESYVSRKIAGQTGQWKLTNVKDVRSGAVAFEPQEFETHLHRLQAFQVQLLNALQRSGQTAFYVDYEDIQDLDVMNGLAAFLGVEGRLDALDRKLKKQNPEPLDEKVLNFAEMEQSLARLDRFNLSRTPNFEPRRGAAVPTLMVAARSALMYLPIKGGPETTVRDWLTALDSATPIERLTQKSLRQWKEGHPGHRSFTVLRHPMARAHAVFCDRILATGPGSYGEIRDNLRRQFNLPVPDGAVGPDWGSDRHRAAFLAFLRFLRANLAGQTSIRVDGLWAGQMTVLQGMAQVVLPDLILRENELAAGLLHLAGPGAPALTGPTDPHAAQLATIYDAEVEKAARDAMGRDYVAFGFGNWALSGTSSI